MPDITMCQNKKCKLRQTCYRFVAKPDKWQSYSEFKPIKGKCAYFLDTRPVATESKDYSWVDGLMEIFGYERIEKKGKK